MRKKDEVSNPASCLNKAKDNEWIFVLLGRDVTAPDVIRFWCQMRVKYHKNSLGDAQITEALALADEIGEELQRTKKASY